VKHLRPLLTAVVLVTIPRVASATPSFPEVVAGHLELSTPPECSLCHNGTPGTGTVTTPFGTSMRSRGARAYDEAAIHTALDALAAEKKDSDSDGTADIDELKAGGDPNGSAGTVTPEYGCTTAFGSATSGGFLVLPALAWLLRRRRARARAIRAFRD
jgi:uncharacterized protein (TIGR03382 family)